MPSLETADRQLSCVCGLWARLVSNQRPLACEASALPLSYAPGAEQFTPTGRTGGTGVQAFRAWDWTRASDKRPEK